VVTIEARADSGERLTTPGRWRAESDGVGRDAGKDGTVRFDAVVPGTHQLRVRAFGYLAAQGEITVPADTGTHVVVVMARYQMTLDGVCGPTFRERVRTPWWKLW
jgi:hypothetical protein